MKTDQLIDLLAAGEPPVQPLRIGRRFLLVAVAGALLAVPVMLVRLGINPDLARDAQQPMFWVKLALVVTLLAAAGYAAVRQARPGASQQGVAAALAAPVLAIWLLALFTLAASDAAGRADLLLGVSWQSCAINIATLSGPAWVIAMFAMKRLAPTRPALAGAAAGLLASCSGALIYTLHCPEFAAPFLAVWYVSGMALPAVLGALVGRVWLRW